MRLKIADSAQASGAEFSGESFVFDFKDPKMNPDVIRMYLSINSDSFKLSYKDANDKHFYVKHPISTFVPSCNVMCSDVEWFQDKLGKLSPEVVKNGVSDLH